MTCSLVPIYFDSLQFGIQWSKLYKALYYWSRDMLNFWFFRKQFGTSFSITSMIFQEIYFSCNILLTDQISLFPCMYFCLEPFFYMPVFLACSHAWHPYVLGVLTCLASLYAWCAHVLGVLAYLACSRAEVLACLACLRAYFLTFLSTIDSLIIKKWLYILNVCLITKK